MTHALKAMPGFDRLIETLKHYGIGVEPRPAFHGALKMGDSVFGEPFDPYLAALYARCDGGLFGDLEIIGCSTEFGMELVRSNGFMRESARELNPRLLKCFEYGNELGEPHYFATIPSLARAGGSQPVVLVLHYMDLLIYPLASNVDRAFDLWARFADSRLRRYGRLDEFMVGVSSRIWRETQLIAHDAELVRMLEAGHFDELMEDQLNSHEWRQSILQAARSQTTPPP